MESCTGSGVRLIAAVATTGHELGPLAATIYNTTGCATSVYGLVCTCAGPSGHHAANCPLRPTVTMWLPHPVTP